MDFPELILLRSSFSRLSGDRRLIVDRDQRKRATEPPDFLWMLLNQLTDPFHKQRAARILIIDVIGHGEDGMIRTTDVVLLGNGRKHRWLVRSRCWRGGNACTGGRGGEDDMDGWSCICRRSSCWGGTRCDEEEEKAN